MQDMSQLQKQYRAFIQESSSLEALENHRLALLGKKGILTGLLKELGALSPEERSLRGAAMNALRDELTLAFAEKKQALEQELLAGRLKTEALDISLAATSSPEGRIHPLTQTFLEVIDIFASMGFSLVEGPEIEEDALNFDALNVPADHPARQDHDTFYMPHRPDGTKMVLRTHTSPVQIREMLNGKPPFQIIAPGRVFRSDYDITHTPMFHQVEGLYIDRNIHMGHMKECLISFLRRFFETADLPVRMRPSYFPFTEPSAEVDIGCQRTKDSFKIGPGQDWLEILGCGMVHPKVLENCGIDPQEYQGFAFGMGLERITMLKYGISDLRMFFEGDLRWLRQYGFSVLDMPSVLTHGRSAL